MNLRQARKIGKRQGRRDHGNLALRADQDAYDSGRLLSACARLYQSWRRACPLAGGRRKILYTPHPDWTYANRVASLHDRGYYCRRAKPPRSAYALGS